MSAYSDSDLALAELQQEYYADPLQWVLDAFPWGEGILAGESGPDVNQREFLQSLGEEIKRRRFDGSTPVMPILMSETSGHGTGKGFGYSTIVSTPYGDVQWGMIQPGNIVFGPDGSPTKVTHRHELGMQPIYRVTFDDGSYAECTLDHLWNVRGRHERRHKLTTWRTISTEEIMEIGVKRPNGAAVARQWEIPIQGPAQLEEREVDVHPYLLGVWIGDGSRNTPEWHKPFPEITDRVRLLGYHVKTYSNGATHRVVGEDHRGFILGSRAHLFRGGVFDKGSHERYLPEEYKFNSIENRKELLRGLLDTDGECSSKQGGIIYSTTSEQLAADVIWLVRSLGGKAQMQPTPKQGWYPNENGERVICRLCYRVTIQLSWNPFTIEHRKREWKPCEARYLSRWIDSIEYSHDEEAMCITVDREDGLYLTNDFIVTHNSAMGAWLTWFILSTRPHSIGTVTAGTYTQLESRTWAAIQWWGKLCITSRWFDIQAHGIYSIEDPENWKVGAQTCKEENAQSFAGQHARTSTSWYLFDEASEVPDGIWDTALGGLTDGEPMVFAWGQCIRNTGRFYEVCFGSHSARWNSRRVDSRTSRFTNKELIAQWEQDYGEDSDYFRVRVLGMPPSASELQYIDRARVEAARSRTCGTVAEDPLIAGFDVSGGGKAWNVIRFRRGLDMGAREPIRIPGEKDPDRSQRIGICAELLSDKRPESRIAAMFVDTAFGAPIVQTLRSMGYQNVYEVAFGGESLDIHYANARAYMYGKMKDALLLGSLPAKDDNLAQQLCLPGYHIRTQGSKLVIESKEDIQARGEKSPDDADALALTFARPVPPLAKAPVPRESRTRYSIPQGGQYVPFA